MATNITEVNTVNKLQLDPANILYSSKLYPLTITVNTVTTDIATVLPDGFVSTTKFANLANNYGTADAEAYVDYLANNGLFFKIDTESQSNVNYNGLNIIAQKSDLPTPAGGVIQLESNTIYYFTATVDLGGDRIVCGTRTALVSATPEIGMIKSTGLSASTALITSTSTIALNFIGLDHATLFDLDASTAGVNDRAIDWTGVNFMNATTAIGTIKDYDNAIMTLIGFLNSGGLTFNGTLGTIAFRDAIFNNATGLTSIIIPSTCTITRRFRVLDSSFISLSGETAINFSTSASVPDEGYIVRNVFFSGGGTYLTGVQPTDNKARFEGCRGVENSGTFGHIYMKANATATTFAGANTPTKILGTTTAGALIERFSMSANNELTLTGAISRKFAVEAVVSITGGANKDFDVYIAKNGTAVTSSKSRSSTGSASRADNVASIEPILLNPLTDTISVYLANATDATSLTAIDLTLIITPISA